MGNDISAVTNSYKPIFEPFSLRSGALLKNRIIMAPMTHVSSNDDGSISDREIQYYTRRAAGVSMVITAASWVSAEGGMAGAAGADSDDLIPGLRKLAASIQSQGALAVLQIFHGGRQSSRTGRFVSASNVPEDREGAIIPEELTEAEISGIIQGFGQAARRAAQAGFDGVEIHGANGNLLHQFFSPYSNRRSDRYGGTLQRRMTLSLAIIEEVKQAIRNYANKPFIIGYRLSPEEPETPGITFADTLVFADALAAKGLDYLHVSQKNYRSVPRRGTLDARSRLAILQERIGQHVPIIGVGSIRTPGEALEALQSGIPLIALARELVIEPDWVQRIREGREGDIKTSLSEHDRQRLSIPEPMWKLITSIPGWFPIEHHGPDSETA